MTPAETKRPDKVGDWVREAVAWSFLAPCFMALFCVGIVSTLLEVVANVLVGAYDAVNAWRTRRG